MKRTRLTDVNSLLIQTALGKYKSDLVIKDGTFVNVYSGEVLENIDVAVKGDRTAYVGEDASHTIGEKTQTIKASKFFIVPGFIDAHTHVDFYCTPTEHSKFSLLHGTTTVFAEPDELANVLGFEGIKLFVKEARRIPLRVYILLPLCSPQDPAFENTHMISVPEIRKALKWRDVVGLGETVSWVRLLNIDDEYFEKIRRAFSLRKRVEGHTAGAKDKKLVAYTASGILSCHESINAKEAVERLRLGMWVMLREGSLRRDLTNILPDLIKQGVDLSRVILVTDSLDPVDAVEYGHMDFVARKAVELGIDPVRAIQMVTVHPAEYFMLDGEIGGIAPGRYADIVLLDDLEKLRVKLTISGGKVLMKDGKLLFPFPSITYPDFALKSIHIPRKLRPEDLNAKAPFREGMVKVRMIELMNEIITRMIIEKLSVVNGNIICAPEKDVIKVVVIDRHWNTGRISHGFLKGFGAHITIATSLNFDNNNAIVIGLDEEDMVLAANKLIDIQGGIVVVSNKRVINYLAMPLAGVMSLDPLPSVAEKLRAINDFIKRSGCPFEKPLHALLFLTFVTLPEVRITDRGLVDVRGHRFVPLIADETSNINIPSS